MIWENLTSPRLAALDRNIPVILSLGAIEQHGSHLPVVTDALIGRHFMQRLDATLGDEVLILPPLAVCCSRHHMDFVGTLTVRHETLFAYVTDILSSVVAHGFRNIVLFNSHGGNLAIGQTIVEAFGNDHPEINIFMLTWWTIAAAELKKIQESGFGGVGHACELETSLMLHIAPGLVEKEKIKDQQPVHDYEWTKSDMLTPAKASHHKTMKELTDGSGTFGCPSFAHAEKGQRISELVTHIATKMLRDISAKSRNNKS